MNEQFWNLFSDDYRENCKKWVHSACNPVIPADPDAEFAFNKHWTANPDILEFGGKTLLYFRGNGVLPDYPGERHDRLAAAELLGTEDGKLRYRMLNGGNPIVGVGKPGSFDCYDVLDPAAVCFRGKVMLYYSAIGAGPESVGLAISEDGEHFEKYGCVGPGRAPDVVLYQDKMYMICVRRLPQHTCWVPMLSCSEDGVHFEDVGPIQGLCNYNDWDSMALTTPRLFRDGDTFYMLYGGSSYQMDEPDYFGLARSQDLIHWQPHPGNPIFGCGAKGSEDGGAIWFPALFEEENQFSMIYEGSRGKYSWDLSSQICLSTLAK